MQLIIRYQHVIVSQTTRKKRTMCLEQGNTAVSSLAYAYLKEFEMHWKPIAELKFVNGIFFVVKTQLDE